MSKYLGIDYGTVHIGLATAEQMLATPLNTLINNEHAIERLVQLVRQEGITTIICGVPEGKLTKQVTRFAADLSSSTTIPVILHPETLSTQEATLKLRSSGASLKKRHNDHAYAACLILEDYLEYRK